MKDVLKTLSSFQDTGHPWHTIAKNGKLIHDEEDPVNEM